MNAQPSIALPEAEQPEPAVAAEPLERIVLDLHGLSVDGVTVGRSRAKKFSVATHKLTVTPADPIDPGAEFTVVVRYRGAPKPLRSPWGTLGASTSVVGSLPSMPSSTQNRCSVRYGTVMPCRSKSNLRDLDIE